MNKYDINKKKRMRIKSLIVFPLFSLLVLVAFVLTATTVHSEEYNTSSPIIRVDYHEIPVDILAFNLTDILGTLYPVHNLSRLSGFDEYNFSVDFLLNGDYTFNVLARDMDENIVLGTKDFTINFGAMNVWLSNPVPAIGKTPQFNINVSSQFDSTCRYMQNSLPIGCPNTIYPSLVRCNYENMFSFDISGNRRVHTLINYPAPSIDQTLYVLCLMNVSGIDPDDEMSYGSTFFPVGYDTTPPTILSLTVDPNPVIDPLRKFTNLTIITNEPTVCKINGGDFNNYSINGKNISIYDDYSTEHSELLYYPILDNELHIFDYNITCYNRAKWDVRQNITVRVYFNASLVITQGTPAYVGTTTIDYVLNTNVGANCSFRMDETQQWLQMEPSNLGRNHTYTNVQLQLGLNHMYARCIAQQVVNAEFTITADDQPPQLVLDAYDATCGLEEINVFVNATDAGTGIATIWYRVMNSSAEIVPWTQMADPSDNTLTIGDLELVDGEEYTVWAYAVDNSGLTSDNQTDTLTATGPYNYICDISPPTIIITYEGGTYQKDVTVNCTDNQGTSRSGCAGTFSYTEIPGLTGSCEGAPYSDSMSYSSLPLSLFEDTYLCVNASDNNNNYATAERAVPVQTIACGNGVVDPWEDCDGTNLGGFTCEHFGLNGGILSCQPPNSTAGNGECTFNTDNCQLGNYGYCGDNVVNNYYNEQCDGTDWGNISDESDIGCKQFGFTGGTITCNSNDLPQGERCMFNTTQCYRTPPNNNPNCDGNSWTVTTLLDPGEQCEPKFFESGAYNLSCTDFDRFESGELGCFDSCILDITNCSGPPPAPFCGDGVIQPSETCDPPNSTMSCDDLDDGAYTGGELVCGNNCDWVSFPCIPVPVCGDGNRTGNEICDGTDLGNMQCTDIDNYIGGTLRCFPESAGPDLECTFDETNCNRGYGYCGDGLINNPWLEQCDGNSWGGISNDTNIGCRQFGFTGGTLSCYAPFTENQCMFDTRGCTDNSFSDDCGDRILQSGEQCETDKDYNLTCSDFDSYTEGALACDYGTCMFDIGDCRVGEQFCGDGIIQPDETCDGTNFGNLETCSDIRPGLTGDLVCFPPGHQNECQIDEDACSSGGGGENETCGDGVVNNWPNELCDGTDLNGLTCTQLGFTGGGTLSCYAAGTEDECQFNVNLCIPEVLYGFCGDGEINLNETCDPLMDPLPITCFNIDEFQGGTLGCFASGPDACTYDITECIPPNQPGICGDGIINNFEQCDLGNLGGMECTRIDNFTGGILGCYPPDYPIEELRCKYDKTTCDRGSGYCGDNVTNNFPNEQCDGETPDSGDWGTIRECNDLDNSFVGGTLECNSCQFDTSNCNDGIPQGYCGDDIVHTGEQCEETVPLDVTCSDFDSLNAGYLDCVGCSIIIDECYIEPDPNCGNGVIDQGEQCDGTNFGETSTLCIDDPSGQYSNGTLTCNAPSTPGECLINYDDCEYIDPYEEGYCGDGIANADDEECDGSDLRDMTCNLIDSLEDGELACNSDCTFNTDNCNAGPGWCGDNIINNFANEQCDGLNWGGITSCSEFGFTGGSLSCNPSTSTGKCMFNTSQCTTPAGFGQCGNGNQILNRGEQCEFGRPLTLNCTDFDSFTGGIIGCDYSTCRYDISECTQSQGTGYCGDGMINDFPNEECDEDDWGNIDSCFDLNSIFTGGVLDCYAPGTDDDCTFDTNGCVSSNGTGGFCGDGRLVPGESCEEGLPLGTTCGAFDEFIGGTLACNFDNCTFDISDCETEVELFCGDGVITPGLGEVCDGNVIGPIVNCSDFDSIFISGQLGCLNNCQYDLSDCQMAPDPICGDGSANAQGEQCDGEDLGGATCGDIGQFINGTLACFPPGSGPEVECKWDTTNCNLGHGFCGDGIINNLGQEQCDAFDWGNINGCSDLGFNGGSLDCYSPFSQYQCFFDTSGCTGLTGGYCGDQVVQIGEQCERNHPLDAVCRDFDSFIGGTLACDYDTCKYDLFDCRLPTEEFCGDGIISGLEDCDGTNLGENTECTDFGNQGFIGGTVNCYPSDYQIEELRCTYDLTSCIIDDEEGYCGDGTANGDEECDGSDLRDMSCNLIGSLEDGELSCNSDCTFNTDNCNAGPGWCGDNIINNFANEQCDGLNWGQIDSCVDFNFTGGSLSCNPSTSTSRCIFNTSQCTTPAGFGSCGNQILNRGEQCDLNRPLTLNCTDFDAFVGGSIICDYSTCRYDISVCDQSQGAGYCGDGLINDFPNEECDGNEWGNFTTCSSLNPIFIGGTLDCYERGTDNACTFDTNGCVSSNGTGGFCGDGRLVPGESCEEGLPLGTTCGAFDEFVGGTLACNFDNCTFDISDCETEHELYCGDGVITPGLGEVCDGEVIGPITECSEFDSDFISGQLGCLYNCQYDLSDCVETNDTVEYCGDGIMNDYPNEQCDMGTNGQECTDFNGFIGGTLSCYDAGTDDECTFDTTQCISIFDEGYCGDGVANSRTEYCDGNDLGSMTCNSIDTFDGGILRCNADCTFDMSNCNAGEGYCGDNIINHFPFEQCDGENWGDVTGCSNFGFTGGTLRCHGDNEANRCLFDTSGCTPSGYGVCGDSIMNVNEQCERNVPMLLGCTDFDAFTGGNISCNLNTCLYDISACEQSQGTGYCGDGTINDFPNEQCDEDDWGDFNTCDDIDPAFNGGTLACGSDCRFDTDDCTSINGEGDCGDGEINDGEQCEEGVTYGAQCNEFDEFIGGNIGCYYDTCEYDLSDCDTEVELYCGDGVITPGIGEQCDGDIIGPVTECSEFRDTFISGQLGCTSDCQFDLSNCVGESTGVCGDNELNSGEQCEPGQTINMTCQDIGFLDGELFCNAEGLANECMLNVSNCVPAINLGYCGDGYVIPDEEWCDTNNLGGLDCTYFDDFTQGILGCYPQGHPDACYWDTSNCGIGTGFCGDGVINNPFNEQCDEDDWGRIDSCVDFGFDSGTLRCYAPEETKKCTFDTSACNTPAGEGPCGNSILNKGEQCEANMAFDLGCTDFDGYIGGTIGCDYSTCQYILDGCELPSVAVCGDGFISGNEQCDGLNLGPTTLCEELDDEFTGGSITCYPEGHRRACRFDVSACEYEIPPAECGNDIIEGGEECDGDENFLTCEDFGLEEGFLGCDDCSVNTSLCSQTLVIEQICGNSRSEPSEECDGGVEDLFEQGFIELYQCEYGLGCSGTCTIECLAEVLNTCDNLIKDGDETGFNCGGSCVPCAVGESCIDNNDCVSGNCLAGICQEEQCMNGVLDGDETGIDCGGSCPACSAGEVCFSDSDCQSGKCVDGLCTAPEEQQGDKPNTAGIVLIILGILFMLGGGGYVVYEEYFDKNKHAPKTAPLMPGQQQRSQQQTMTIDPRILEMQKKKQEERRQQQQDARKSLLEGFDKESVPKSEDDIEQLKEKKVNKEVLKEAGYVDLTEQKPKEKESSDVFNKLKKIGNKEPITESAPKDTAKDDAMKLETYDVDGKKDSGVDSSSEDAGKSSKTKKTKILKVKRKSDTFERLGSIGKSVSKEDIKSTSNRISEFSGKNKSSITRVLNSDSISQKQINNIFSNLDKEKLTSDVFKEILSDLVSKGKLSKETVSGMLFEYMDQGILDKSDVAKIMSQLKMV